MKVLITKRIVQSLLDNDEQSKLVVENSQLGGSSTTFETPDGYDETLNLVNDFDVKNIQTFEFNLRGTFNFSLEIFSLLKGSLKNVSFIEIWCVESTELGKIPVRFDLQMGGSGGVLIPMGRVSSFSLVNVKSLLFKSLTVSNISIKPESVATLFIFIGTSDNFSI